MKDAKPLYHGYRFPPTIISHAVWLYHRYYLWRAIDQDGDTIDIPVQKHSNKAAAKRFFGKLLKGQNEAPERMITDKLKSYSAAHREVLPSVPHSTAQYPDDLTSAWCRTQQKPDR